MSAFTKFLNVLARPKMFHPSEDVPEIEAEAEFEAPLVVEDRPRCYPVPFLGAHVEIDKIDHRNMGTRVWQPGMNQIPK